MMLHIPGQLKFGVWLGLVAAVTCQVTDHTAVSVGDQIWYGTRMLLLRFDACFSPVSPCPLVVL